MFTVVYDANVLYSAPLRDLLVRLARTRPFHGRWTDAILDGTLRSIIANRPDLDEGNLERQGLVQSVAALRALMFDD